MSQTTGTTTPPKQDANVSAQDRWVTTFTGVETRRGTITIGEHRAEPQPTWQSATPSDPTAPKMQQPRDLKLAEVDAALLGLTEAADDIGAPLGRAGVEPDIVRATEGRDALANAADRGEIAKQLAAAPALLEGIETARLAAVKDKADCLTLADKTKVAGDALGLLNKAADEIGSPLGRTGVQQDIDKLTEAHAALGKATTREALAKEIEAATALPGRIEEVGKAVEKDKADCAAWAEQKEKVRLALEAVENAAQGIGAPLLRTAIDPEINAVKLKAEALDKAATREAVAKEVAAAPALVGEIGKVGEQAGKDKDACVKLAEEKEKVRLALEAVENAAQGIGAPLLRTAIDPEINAVKLKAEALDKAATREAIAKEVAAAPALVGEIEKVGEQAGKDKDACVALDLKTKEVAAALLGLDNAAKLITAKIARDPVDPDIKKVTDAHGDLAKAADRAEIAKQLAAVPQLLLDIESARQAAVAAEVEWQKLAAKKADVEKTLGSANVWISWIPGGTVKSGLEGDAKAVKQSLDNLKNAASLQAYSDALNLAETAAATAKTKAYAAGAPPYADSQLKTLGKWLPIFKPIAEPNPVKTQFDALTVRKNSAGSTTDPKATLLAIGNDAFAACTAAKKAYAADQIVFRALEAAKASASGVSAPSFKNTLLTYIGDAETDRTNAYTATTVAALLSKLEDLKKSAERLRVAMAGVAPMTQAVEKSLIEADTAIKQLPSGASPRNELAIKYADLRLRLTNAGTETDYWKQQDQLSALDKEALALVEEARTATFQEKAKTTVGKQEIDELIKSFGAATDDPVRQAVCRAAMQACYGVGIKAPEGVPIKSLPALYQMMTLMPKKDFDGLKKIKYETDPLINTSYYGQKKVVLNKIGDGTSEYDLVNQADPTQKERVNYFNFTALHEFGHHVDGENGVMRDHGKNAGFGQWKQETIDSVVDAVYTAAFAALTTVTPPPITQPPKTTSGSTGEKPPEPTPPPPPPPTEADLKLLIRTLLDSGAATKPTSATVKPLGTLFNAWDKIEGKEGWKKCLAIRNPAQSPWNKPTEITAGRAFHEGYDGDWYSYDTGERTSGGISHYQFRSPVEWFAEQYAFYKLKPGKTKPTAIATYLAM